MSFIKMTATCYSKAGAAPCLTGLLVLISVLGGSGADASLLVAMVGDSICQVSPPLENWMGWCNLLATDQQYDTCPTAAEKRRLWGASDNETVTSMGVGGLEVFQFCHGTSPADSNHWWGSLREAQPRYVLWNLGEDDQQCFRAPCQTGIDGDPTACDWVKKVQSSDWRQQPKDCIHFEWQPQMEAMISDQKSPNVRHILVTPAPLIQSGNRMPPWDAYEELIQANQNLHTNHPSSVATVLPLWNALDCYYGKRTQAQLIELVHPSEVRHTNKCGAAVHVYVMLALLKSANLPGLEPDLSEAQTLVTGSCGSTQDLPALLECVRGGQPSPVKTSSVTRRNNLHFDLFNV